MTVINVWSLEGFTEWVCFPTCEEWRSQCRMGLHHHPPPLTPALWFTRWIGKEDVGRAELCAVVLSLLCAWIILYLRLDFPLALRQGNRIILIPPQEFSTTQTLPFWGLLEFQPPPNLSSYLLIWALNLAFGPPPLEMWPVTKQTQAPFVALSTLEADHGNFLNLGPQPEAFIIRHGAVIRAETINYNSTTRTPQSCAHEGNPVYSAWAGSPRPNFPPAAQDPSPTMLKLDPRHLLWASVAFNKGWQWVWDVEGGSEGERVSTRKF